MQQIINTGKYLFAIALLALGVIQLVSGGFPGNLIPLLATMPGKTLLVYLTGAIFSIASVCIIINWRALQAALTLGILFLIFIVYPQIPNLLSDVYNPEGWVSFLEILSFFSGAVILADKLAADSATKFKWRIALRKAALVSRYLFAIAVLIFGIQHFIYADFLVTLVPKWIPGKSFWCWLVKIAFLATALSIVINVRARLATFLLGIMFMIWVLILHAPRVFKNPELEPEWTSLFIALAMCGICFILADKGRKTSLN